MTASARVSVVMAVRNGSAFLANSIESILAQTFRWFEFIVVDDGSSDGTCEIVRAYASGDQRIRVVTRPPRGLVAALNEGCSLAQASLIARMDADDIAAPTRLEVQVARLHESPKIGLLGTAARVIDGSGRTYGTLEFPSRDAEIRSLLEKQNAFAHPTVMFRREVFVGVGGYRQAALDAEDYDLWLRMADVTQMANLENVLLDYRVHPGNVTSANLKQQVLTMVAARAAADLRRLEGLDPLDNLGVVDLDTIAKLGVSRGSLQAAVENAYLARAGAELRVGRRSEALELLALAREFLNDAGVSRRRPRLDVNEARLRFATRRYLHAGILLTRALFGAPLATFAMAARALRRSTRRTARLGSR